ncbi:MAG: tetratricopeptide repeat protein [FCB group bacterium]|jgi:tetratricopeptide (TPR) repeat protein|nr:tetratricopeptide repeat protein [FCB group bacterium]
MFKFISISFLSVALLLPYFGWGIYVLRQRLRNDAELNHLLELATLGGLAVFYILEVSLLAEVMAESKILFFFSMLGLVVSSAALYGPMLITLLSDVIVESVMPAGLTPAHEPKYGGAEALERQGDYLGAVKEYMVIARVFPKDPTAAIRIADNLVKLGRLKEAAEWFERGLERIDTPQKSLMVTNRLYDLYQRHLGQPERARDLLEEYLDRYPNAEQAVYVRERLKHSIELLDLARQAP